VSCDINRGSKTEDILLPRIICYLASGKIQDAEEQYFRQGNQTSDGEYK
jgi:hypothetical protein